MVWVCLFLSLWRAPVPCFHAHDDAGERSAGDDLTAHLAHYHARPGLEVHGWHLHFVTLRDLLRGGGCPVPDHREQPNPDEMPVVPSLAETTIAPAVATSFLPAECGRVLPPLPAGESDATLGTGGPATNGEFALPAGRRLPLLCVARC